MSDVESITFEEFGYPPKTLRVGDIVGDDLTRTEARVVRISVENGQTAGIWLDNDYVGGGRHPWEITLRRSPSTGDER